LRRQVILDTGPLVALLNSRDKYHDWAKTLWAEVEPPLITCEAVIAEACFLMGKLGKGSSVVVEMLRRGAVATSFSLTDELDAVRRLLERYGSVPMSLADACLVRMSELYGDSEVMTVDSDFRIYRRHGRRVIPALMPERS
jgi:predicted nucleic acid-binding protein